MFATIAKPASIAGGALLAEWAGSHLQVHVPSTTKPGRSIVPGAMILGGLYAAGKTSGMAKGISIGAAVSGLIHLASIFTSFDTDFRSY